jgi:hypothetical protein
MCVPLLLVGLVAFAVAFALTIITTNNDGENKNILLAMREGQVSL